MNTRVRIQQLSVFAISSVMSLFCLVVTGHAAPDEWLITPEEAAMAPAPEANRGVVEVRREDITAGPVIDVVEPQNGSREPMPVQVLIRFTPMSEPLDLASLKVTLIKFIQIDITDRLRPYVTPDGIQVKEAKIPSGKHHVRISLADRTGAVSIREVIFEVLEVLWNEKHARKDSGLNSPVSSPPRPCLFNASVIVFIMAAEPRGAFIAFISPLGHQIKVVVGRIEHVEAARIRGVVVKHVPLGVFVKDAGSFPI